MSAEFYIKQCYDVGGLSLILAGSVESGEITEGVVGTTSRGKRFTVVKIEKQGDKVPRAFKKDNVNLSIKNISRADIKPGELCHF